MDDRESISARRAWLTKAFTAFSGPSQTAHLHRVLISALFAEPQGRLSRCCVVIKDVGNGMNVLNPFFSARPSTTAYHRVAWNYPLERSMVTLDRVAFGAHNIIAASIGRYDSGIHNPYHREISSLLGRSEQDFQ
jgi:hypothetical protein